ncbi:hypothetical protein DNH61_11810 [Paenibacillus sambharensis]|uniref:Uncharacterized protein n=1 Tax=Paenibacillus sambharensis TaxID=1803190 RepID=A0A2W1L8T9_9BACL|nr:hypothetical protein [Paenibacillus sambharensis]PZD95239.1 hypothetical protein DNH61_11810 [Paenibacillus sambharensis]
MPQGFQQPVTVDLSVAGGINTVAQPTALAANQARYMINGVQPQGKIGPCAQRPGSIPVTTTALSNPIRWLTLYRTGAIDKIIATAGTSLYRFNGSALQPASGALTSADIYEVDFTDRNSVSRKIITDTGGIKAYNDDTFSVADIVPAADDATPNPPNILSQLHTKKMKYCFSYQGHLFVSDGSDQWWYSKRWTFDYFPSVQWERWVRQNDYMNGPGIAFDNVLMLPMRRGWGVLFGTNFDTFQGNQFLNTQAGVVAPRSIQRITYPDGAQSVVYLSDDGIYEIYDTQLMDTGSRRYATRSISVDKVDLEAIGLSEAEKTAAVGYYDPRTNLYMLRFNKGEERLCYAYDTRNREWYPWTNIKANGFVRAGELYYAGESGHLHKFDANLGSDWNNAGKTSGTPINFYRASDMLKFETTGQMSVLDEVIVNARQYATKSSLDVKVVFYSSMREVNQAIKNTYMTWDVTAWDDGVWANLEYTDLVSAPKPLIFCKNSYYFQIIFKNDRDELCEIYDINLKGRASGY